MDSFSPFQRSCAFIGKRVAHFKKILILQISIQSKVQEDVGSITILELIVIRLKIIINTYESKNHDFFLRVVQMQQRNLLKTSVIGAAGIEALLANPAKLFMKDDFLVILIQQEQERDLVIA